MREKTEGKALREERGIFSLISVTGKRRERRETPFRESCLVQADSVTKFTYYVNLVPLAERISVRLADSTLRWNFEMCIDIKYLALTQRHELIA